MLVRSALVRMATAEASARLTVAWVWRWVASADDHRDAEGPGPAEVAVVVVPLDHHHPPPLGQQTLHHPDPDRPEPDHHDVAGHARAPGAARATARSAGSTSMLVNRAKLVVTRVTPTTMRTMAKTWSQALWAREGVVAEPDRGHGLDREVERGQQVEVARGVAGST